MRIHLLHRGIMQSYINWYNHGEPHVLNENIHDYLVSTLFAFYNLYIWSCDFNLFGVVTLNALLEMFLIT